MKPYKLLRLFVLAVLGLAFSPGAKADHISLGMTVTTNAAAPNRVTFTVTFTNTAAVTATDVTILNQLSSAAIITNANHVIFAGEAPIIPVAQIRNDVNPPRVDTQIGSLPSGAGGSITLVAEVATPAQIAALANTVTINADGHVRTLTRSGADATPGGGGGGATGDADMLAFIVVNTSPIAGDQFGVTVGTTNLGPAIATNVVMTSEFGHLRVLSISPTTPFTTNATGQVILNLGSVNPNTSREFTFQVTTTNTATVGLTNSVTAGNNDPVTANNTAGRSLMIAPTNSPNATVSVVAGQTLNRQTGLFEEIVRVSNTGPDPIPSFRLTVVGLGGTNILYNAVGTNNTHPFVVHAAELPAGQSTDLTLEYFSRFRTPIQGLSHFVTEILAFNTATNYSAGTNVVNITNVNNRVLVQFPATVGRRYTILYSDNPAFTNNVFRAQPSVRAEANWVQWFDTGPPKTLSDPMTAGTRFYRVLEGQ